MFFLSLFQITCSRKNKFSKQKQKNNTKRPPSQPCAPVAKAERERTKGSGEQTHGTSQIITQTGLFKAYR